MSKRNLLLCFDAFGTLFKPKRPIAQQYGEVARSVGLSGFNDEELDKSFRAAFKQESKENPNYGRATDMSASRWWSNIIHNTFTPLVGSDQRIEDELAPRLVQRFGMDEGYTIFPDVIPLIHQLPKYPQATTGAIAVGVITNSDDRVPGVLTSLGLRVSPYRYGHEPQTKPSAAELYDIDFSVMSYDVGHEKPDDRIFKAAEEMLQASPHGAGTDMASWSKVYVGDEYDKDIVGALNADWYAVLIDREKAGQRAEVEWLDSRKPGHILEVLKPSQAVGFSSLEKFAEWLPKSTHESP